jgi:hypothetical protein
MASNAPNHARCLPNREVCRWFAFGNVAIACLLVCVGFAAPIDSPWLDGPVIAEALALWISGFGVLFGQAWALTLLRLAAQLLLGFGLIAVALLALTSAFLFGVHGNFLRDGIELVVIGFGLAIPYTIAYPMLLLARVKPTKSDLQT